jgi:adenylate cyclase class IV
MREVELKSVVDDVQSTRRAVETAGGKLEFEGELIDLRYADRAGQMLLQDHVLRLRVYDNGAKREGHLDWKGPTRFEDGYKVREELSTTVGDADSLALMLANLGYIVIKEIERHIAQYSVAGATVRFEEYPRMDALIEVEGTPEAIEQAIAATGLPRSGFGAGRLTDFVAAFEMRTGERAAVSKRELAGDFAFPSENA